MTLHEENIVYKNKTFDHLCPLSFLQNMHLSNYRNIKYVHAWWEKWKLIFAIFYLISIEIQEDHRYNTVIFAFDLLCIIIYFTIESYISSANLVLLAKTFCVHIIFERWKSRLEWRKMVRALFIVFHYCSRKEAGKIGWVEWAERLFCYIFLLFVLFWWRSNQ